MKKYFYTKISGYKFFGTAGDMCILSSGAVLLYGDDYVPYSFHVSIEYELHNMFERAVEDYISFCELNSKQIKPYIPQKLIDAVKSNLPRMEQVGPQENKVYRWSILFNELEVIGYAANRNLCLTQMEECLAVLGS